MTELGFLIDLLLNHKLPKATRDSIATRIKEVECKTSSLPTASLRPAPSPMPQHLPPHIANQTPSMQAIMMRNQDLIQSPGDAAVPATAVHAMTAQPEPPQPVAVVAQTPAAVAAINERQAHLAQARSGKPLPGETRPRKW